MWELAKALARLASALATLAAGIFATFYLWRWSDSQQMGDFQHAIIWIALAIWMGYASRKEAA